MYREALQQSVSAAAPTWAVPTKRPSWDDGDGSWPPTRPHCSAPPRVRRLHPRGHGAAAADRPARRHRGLGAHMGAVLPLPNVPARSSCAYAIGGFGAHVGGTDETFQLGRWRWIMAPPDCRLGATRARRLCPRGHGAAANRTSQLESSCAYATGGLDGCAHVTYPAGTVAMDHGPTRPHCSAPPRFDGCAHAGTVPRNVPAGTMANRSWPHASAGLGATRARRLCPRGHGAAATGRPSSKLMCLRDRRARCPCDGTDEMSQLGPWRWIMAPPDRRARRHPRARRLRSGHGADERPSWDRGDGSWPRPTAELVLGRTYDRSEPRVSRLQRSPARTLLLFHLLSVVVRAVVVIATAGCVTKS